MHSSFCYPSIISKPNKTKPPHLDLFVQQDDSSSCRFLFLHENGILYFHRKSKSSLLRKNDSFFSFTQGKYITPNNIILLTKKIIKMCNPLVAQMHHFFYFYIGRWLFQSLRTNFFSTTSK
eukprot:TRINITY_DN18276_c0_g2_i1.p1 TRINITY_DN18276_c0_g2~~TRINITY_DN18276_c0_g2_i1.p1  ORF type:complete len:121 (+),score=2.04 TRINITY_DN18276_c0_g2_i1:72-434(+)